MDGNLEISLDKLPLKRLEAIEENGLERFPAYASYFSLSLHFGSIFLEKKNSIVIAQMFKMLPY